MGHARPEISLDLGAPHLLASLEGCLHTAGDPEQGHAHPDVVTERSILTQDLVHTVQEVVLVEEAVAGTMEAIAIVGRNSIAVTPGVLCQTDADMLAIETTLNQAAVWVSLA